MPARNLYINENLYRRYVLVAEKRQIKLTKVLTEALEKSIDQLEARANFFDKEACES